MITYLIIQRIERDHVRYRVQKFGVAIQDVEKRQPSWRRTPYGVHFTPRGDEKLIYQQG